jgi:hypothetical protein
LASFFIHFQYRPLWGRLQSAEGFSPTIAQETVFAGDSYRASWLEHAICLRDGRISSGRLAYIFAKPPGGE